MILKCSKLDYQKKCDELLKRIEEITKENEQLTQFQNKLLIHESNEKNKSYYDLKMKIHPRYMISKKSNSYSTTWNSGLKDAAHGGITEPNLTYKTVTYQDSQIPSKYDNGDYLEEDYDE